MNKFKICFTIIITCAYIYCKFVWFYFVNLCQFPRLYPHIQHAKQRETRGLSGVGGSKKNCYIHLGNRNKKLAGNLVGPTTSGEAQEPITGSRIASRRTNSRINTRLPRLRALLSHGSETMLGSYCGPSLNWATGTKPGCGRYFYGIVSKVKWLPTSAY